jgi:hypothetical protein
MNIKQSIFKVMAFGLLSIVATFAKAQSLEKYYEKLSEYEGQYQTYYDDGQYDLAIQPLTDLIHFLDTTTAFNGPQYDESREQINQSLASYKANTYYNLACSYSLSHQKKAALSALDKAIALGYKDYANMKNDSDFDFICNEKRFKSLLKQLEQYDHLFILKNAAPYSHEDTDSLPRFVYQSSDETCLKQVREFFSLDEIAGEGDEISKILNILRFVHDSIRHDGNNYALCEFDAIDIYNYHKSTGKGVNCRHLAITLNEMYLSMGFYSRYVTCMPKDPDDQDCHVINAVWSSQLKKWIWVDPTFYAYVMDENGTLLGIDEVRERLIDSRPLVLNEDANWNHKSKQTKEYYLENYMAKNLYYIECVTESRFNPESRYRNTGSKYVELVPSDVEKVSNGWIIQTYDADYFWQSPE